MKNPPHEPLFWQTTPLEQMSREQWESLCDGCARCCIVKFEDIDTGAIFYTDVVCPLLDIETCSCGDYPHRSQLVPTCLSLDPDLIKKLKWMPETCAYQRLVEGKPLEWWHPLVSGNPNTVHQAGISIRGKVISEKNVPEDELEEHIIDPEDED